VRKSFQTVSGSGILRTSPFGDSRKYRTAPALYSRISYVHQNHEPNNPVHKKHNTREYGHPSLATLANRGGAMRRPFSYRLPRKHGIVEGRLTKGAVSSETEGNKAIARLFLGEPRAGKLTYV
jgi:hypothetical protein